MENTYIRSEKSSFPLDCCISLGYRRSRRAPWTFAIWSIRSICQMEPDLYSIKERRIIYINALSLSFYHHLLFYQSLGFDRTCLWGRSNELSIETTFDRTDSIRFRPEGRLEIWNTFSAVVGKVNFSISEVAFGTHRWFISQPHWVSSMIFFYI